MYNKKHSQTSKLESYVRPSIKEKVVAHAARECISVSKAVELALDTYYREHPVK